MDERASLFGIEIDPLRLEEAAARVLDWCTERGPAPCRYVVTPNVDHVVMLAERDDLRRAYAEASLVLADGFPVVRAARLLGRTIPERVAGSDLAPAIFTAACAASRRLRVFLLGAAPGVAERAAERIQATWSKVEVSEVDSPPLGFEHSDAENSRILEKIRRHPADLLILGLGAPKQELWIHHHYREIPCRAALCIGATIDFLAGEKNRAPLWMQRGGLEWLHRVATEPRRLASRYLRDAWIFPRLVWRQWRSDRRGSRLPREPRNLTRIG